MSMSRDISDLIFCQCRYDRFKTQKCLDIVNSKYLGFKKKYEYAGYLPIFNLNLAKAEAKKGCFIAISREQ